MKTDEEVNIALNNAIINGMRSDSMEQLRFYQGQINILEWCLGKNNDGFEEEKK